MSDDNVIPFPGFEQPQPLKMYCAGCGADRTNPTTAADPGPCSCGATWRVSHPSMVQPGLGTRNETWTRDP